MTFFTTFTIIIGGGFCLTWLIDFWLEMDDKIPIYVSFTIGVLLPIAIIFGILFAIFENKNHDLENDAIDCFYVEETDTYIPFRNDQQRDLYLGNDLNITSSISPTSTKA